jgi:AP2 domain
MEGADGYVPVGYIPLTRGMVAIVDVVDLPLVGGVKWHAAVRERGVVYAASTVGYMHRVILGLRPGDPGPDHIDRNGLNNRRANLRPADVSHNNANTRPRPGTSRFKGVSWDAQRGRWMAKVCVGGHQRALGRFDDEEEAARAYDAAALQAWGEYAYLNLPAEVA